MSTSSFDASRSAGYDSRISKMVLGYQDMHRLVEVVRRRGLPTAHRFLYAPP